MLSKYWFNIAKEYGIITGGVSQLVSNLDNKSKYVVHYRNLELYLSLRMKLTKIHGVLKFKQSDWLKKYIDFNTDKRKISANSFEKDFFKLMNYSVFGKTMENFRKRISVKLVSNSKDFIRCISKPSFFSQKILSKNFVAIHDIKPVLTLNEPVYVGFSILDLSKLLMYEFHYKYLKSKFDANLLFADTCSLVDETKTEDFYEHLYEDKDSFDFSDYPLNSKFFDSVNKVSVNSVNSVF